MSESTVEFPIELQGVRRSFGRTVAVRELSLRVEKGKTFGFIGLNGAGKTTAIRMMVGLLKPHAGSILINGVRVPEHRDAMKEHVGYVPDRPHVYPWMSVDDATAFVRSFYPQWNANRCGELIKLFQLDRSQRVKHMSKGQGAKLSLLLAICHDPAVLILDEPTSGLDPLVREEFLEGVLAATAEREQTVLFSSHTLADVQRLADSVGLMHNGSLLFHSPVDVLLERTKRIRAVLEDTSEIAHAYETPPGLVWEQRRGREWLMTVKDFTPDQIDFVRARNRISHLDVEDLTLDDVFKDYVRSQKKEVV